MKAIRYSRYTGEDLGIEAEELLKALADFLLGSGFDNQYMPFSEMNQHTLEDLKNAIQKALEQGDLFDNDSLPSTPDSASGVAGAVSLTGPGIAAGGEVNPWTDPANLGDMFTGENLSFTSFLGLGATMTWHDDTDFVPEPATLTIVAAARPRCSILRSPCATFTAASWAKMAARLAAAATVASVRTTKRLSSIWMAWRRMESCVAVTIIRAASTM